NRAGAARVYSTPRSDRWTGLDAGASGRRAGFNAGVSPLQCCERRAEPFKSDIAVIGRPAFEGDNARVPSRVQRRRDGRIVDLASPRLAASGYISDLHFADVVDAPP